MTESQCHKPTINKPILISHLPEHWCLNHCEFWVPPWWRFKWSRCSWKPGNLTRRKESRSYETRKQTKRFNPQEPDGRLKAVYKNNGLNFPFFFSFLSSSDIPCFYETRGEMQHVEGKPVELWVTWQHTAHGVQISAQWMNAADSCLIWHSIICLTEPERSLQKYVFCVCN